MQVIHPSIDFFKLFVEVDAAMLELTLNLDKTKLQHNAVSDKSYKFTNATHLLDQK